MITKYDGLNLKLKKGVDPNVLIEYGFVPKYDEDTGGIKAYKKKIHVDGGGSNESHFTFVLRTKTYGGIFHKFFDYESWMSMFKWTNVCDKEAMQLLYDLIIDGIVEPAELKKSVSK